MLQVLRSCKWPIGRAVVVVEVTDFRCLRVYKKMLSELGLPYIHPWVPKIPLISSFSFSDILTIFLSSLKVSLISLMNSVENFLICKPVVSWPSCCYLFPDDIYRIESTQIHSSLHRMEMHSWMGNKIASLWSVISYLGSHIVPGFLVQTISRIIALIKKVNFIIFWYFMEGFSFSLMIEKCPMQKL